MVALEAAEGNRLARRYGRNKGGHRRHTDEDNGLNGGRDDGFLEDVPLRADTRERVREDARGRDEDQERHFRTKHDSLRR